MTAAKPRGNPRPRRRRLGAMLPWAVVAASALFAAGVAGAVLVSRTAAGRGLALEWALAQLRPAVNGTISVASLAPGGLLGGAVLRQVELRDTTGHPVLVADSIQARYSLAALFGGAPAIADLNLWGLALDLAPAAGGRVDLGTLAAPRDSPDPDPDAAPPAPPRSGPALRINGARIQGAALVSRAADGARRRIHGIDIDLARLDILPGSDLYLSAAASAGALVYPAGRGEIDISGIEASIEVGPDGILIDADRFRLPRSEGRARLLAEPDGNRLRATFDIEADRLALADLSWIDERFDHGHARGSARIVNGRRDMSIELNGVAADLGAGGRAVFTGILRGDHGDTIVQLDDMTIEAERLDTDELAPYFPDGLPASGLVTGAARFNRDRSRLDVDGAATVTARQSPDTLVRLSGRWTRLANRAVADVELRAAPLDYALLRHYVPGLSWRGRGSMTIRADGHLESGLAVDLAASHELPGHPPSAVTVAGTLYGDTAASVVDLAAALNPLSLSMLAEMQPGFPFAGAAAGSLSLSGPLDRLNVEAALETDAGPLAATGAINARDPADRYEMSVSTSGLVLSRLLPGLPDSTIVSGAASVAGSGLDPASARGALDLNVGPSTVGGLPIDALSASAWVDDAGLLHLEDAHADAGGVRIEGRGSIGMAPGARGEGVDLALSSPSIHRLRDLFMGSHPVVWDELLPIEQEYMVRLDGADPDTIPRAIDVRFAGALNGAARIDGSLDDLRAAARLSFAGLEYGPFAADTLHANLSAAGLRATGPSTPSVSGTIAGDSIEFRGRRFASASLEGGFAPGSGGRLRALIDRSASEFYDLQAVLRLDDEGGGRLDLDRFTLRFPDRRWSLQGPARVEWNPAAVTVSNLGLIRPGADGLRLSADGTLARSAASPAPPADSDFDFRMTGLDLATLSRLLQLETPVAGLLDVELAARGTGADPVWTASGRADGVAFETLRFDEVDFAGSAADQTLDAEIESRTGGRRTIRAAGVMPLDLRLGQSARRIPDLPLDLDIAADSFPARMILGGLKTLEEIGGSVTGQVALGGRPSDLEPDGQVRLEGVTALMTPFGIRLSSVDIDMDLSPDGVVAVNGSGASGGASGGTMDVTGTVDLGHAADSVPLNLVFKPRSFLIVDRPDMEAAITSDSVTLTGSYEFPFIQGSVEVEDGTVFMEEFQRTAEAVDLYDPDLLRAATRSIGEDAEVAPDRVRQLPFLQNLRIFVDVRVGSGNWLRSRAMNVETSGDLLLTFDRGQNQLILQGEMGVVQGAYNLGPRPLHMTDGVFQFVGTPGFNPGLSVTAEARLPTREGPLTITADISGTLLEPSFILSSDESALPPDDLFNYLVLGRPTSAMAGAAGAASVATGVSNLLLGQVVNEIGYLLAMELNVDHLSVSQSEQGASPAAFGASSVQVEVGRYILDDVFLTAVYQRGFCADPTLPVNTAGVRVEVAMPRDMRLEGFVENRCTREGYRGLGDISLELAGIWGFSLFREWGY